jgi:hypothetical protein
MRANERWMKLDGEGKAGKRAREMTLEEFELRGVGAGSTVDDDGEVLSYTVRNGVEGEDSPGYEAYPREE